MTSCASTLGYFSNNSCTMTIAGSLSSATENIISKQGCFCRKQDSRFSFNLLSAPLSGFNNETGSVVEDDGAGLRENILF